jgi:trimeric autotransporter adhesin
MGTKPVASGKTPISNFTYYALGDNIENLAGAGNIGQQLVGNAGNNTITGDAGADTLDGGVAGTDILNGRGGDDIYKVLHDQASVTEAANEGTDTVWFYGSTFTLGANVENLESKGIAGSSQVLTGNDLDNTYTSLSGVNSTFNALGGNDYFDINDNANHTIDGGEGDESIHKSGSGTTTMIGGGGNDRFYISGGANALQGGLGNDYYWVSDATNTIQENTNEGTDTVATNLAIYTLDENVEDLGGVGDDQTLTGNGLDNEITTGEGAINVTINGGGGNDFILAWSESSTLNGDAGNDTLDGTGETSFNTFAGGVGDDTYILAMNAFMFASDTILENANEGIDIVLTATESTTLYANVENLTGTATTGQILDGNELNNHITGNRGNDTLTGNAGNDDLNGGVGADAMSGGTGDDTYHIDDAGDTMTELTGEGIDTIFTSVDNLALNNFANLENVTMVGLGNLTVYGSESANILIGNTGANSIFGNGGNDTVNGGGGSDTLNGGLGNDLVITDGGDTINDSGGIDTVQSSVTYTLGNAFEKLVLTGTAARGTGNALANTITGNASTNTLSGLGASDTLSGGAGKDILVGGTGRDFMTGGTSNDVFDFNSVTETGKTSTTRDVIKDFTHLADDIDLKTIDASTKIAGNQTFKFIGTQAFHKIAGELHYAQSNLAGTASDKTIISGDVNGDGYADFNIELTGLKTLSASDFIL